MSAAFPSDQMFVVYDGECPFCANYVRLTRLRASAGPVKLIDARSSDDPIVKMLRQAGYDLNEGMAAVYGDTVYFGKDAIVLLSSLTDSGSYLSRALGRLLRDKRRAAVMYPLMKAGRRATLAVLGRSLIG